METNWDWDYFYSGKIKEWEGCKTWKEKCEWRKKHLSLAIENSFSKWRLKWVYTRQDIVSTIINDILKAIKGISWQRRRIFWCRFKRKMEEAAEMSIATHRAEWASDWRNIETETFEEEVHEVITAIVEGFKAWTSPIIWMTKPENIIAWEFGKMPEKNTSPKKVEPSILWKIKSKEFGNLEAYIWKVTQPYYKRRMQIEHSIECFLKTRFPANKIRMFRPDVAELREYLKNTIEDKSVDFLIEMYCKAYADKMPFLCGIFGDYGILNAERRKNYFRSRKTDKALRKVWKEFDKLPVDFVGYYQIMESLKTEMVSKVKIEGDIESEQCVLEEIHDLIIKVIHPILNHLARVAVERADIREFNPLGNDGRPIWDELVVVPAYKHVEQSPWKRLSTAAINAEVEKELEGLKTFTIRMYDADKKSISEKYTTSSMIYGEVYQWYWRKGKEIFDRVIEKSGVWGKKKEKERRAHE